MEAEKPQARMEVKSSTFQTFSTDFSSAAKLHWLVIVHKYMKAVSKILLNDLDVMMCYEN